MKRIAAIICAIIICLSVLCGCAKRPLPDLPGDALAFEMGTFIDDIHDDDSFATIEYGGRTYIQYGTTNNNYSQTCVEACIGYIIQDGNSSSVTDLDNTDRRIYTLSGDPEHNFLMDYDDSVKLMNQPSIFRATDTKEKDIDIPNYIDSLGYDFWEEQ